MVQIDSKTVEGLLKGEDWAYAKAIDSLQGPVYRFLLRLTSDAGAAEDLTQETFLAVWKGIASFAGKSKLSTWVLAIAYRQYLRWREKHLTIDLPLDDEFDRSPLPDPCTAVQETEERRRIRDAVYRLPNPYREAVSLVYLEDLSYSEAANVLDVPVGTVKSRVHGALNLLRRKLTGTEVDADEVRRPDASCRRQDWTL